MSEFPPPVNENTLAELLDFSRGLFNNIYRGVPEVEKGVHDLAGNPQIGSGAKQVSKVGFKDKPLVDQKDIDRANQLKKEWEAPSASGIKGFFINPFFRPGLAAKKTVATLGEGLGVKMYEPRNPLSYNLLERVKKSDYIPETYKTETRNTLGIDHDVQVIDKPAVPEKYKYEPNPNTEYAENPLNGEEYGMFGGTPTKANVLSEAAGRAIYATGLMAASNGLGITEGAVSLAQRMGMPGLGNAGIPLSRDEMTKRAQELIQQDQNKLQTKQDEEFVKHGFIVRNNKVYMDELNSENEADFAAKHYGKETNPMGNWLLNSLYQNKNGKSTANPDTHKIYFDRFNKSYKKDLSGGNDGAREFFEDIQADYHKANHDADIPDNGIFMLPSIKKQNQKGGVTQINGDRVALFVDRKNNIYKFVDINNRKSMNNQSN